MLCEHHEIQALACDTISQEDLYAGVPLVERLTGIKEMKIEGVTMGKHHQMCYPPYMRHNSVIVFHTNLPLLNINEGT